LGILDLTGTHHFIPDPELTPLFFAAMLSNGSPARI